MKITLDERSIHFDEEIVALLMEIEEFKGAWKAYGNLTPERLTELQRIATIESIGSSTRIEGGKLTDEEYEVMKSHPEQAAKMLMGIKKLTVVSNWLRCHHERWDGHGYPKGLKGEEIPISGRIIALADTYDAMTSTRSYRQALTHETAMEEIKRCAGTQFDPVLAELFIKCSDEIKAAKEDPETYYPKYSYLQKQIYETK